VWIQKQKKKKLRTALEWVVCTLSRTERLEFTNPFPHDQTYSRSWYAFSLFLRKFHSVNPFNGNLCELGRARSAEKKMEFPSQVVRKRILCYFQPNSEPVQGRSEAVHDERAEWTCSWHTLCSKNSNLHVFEVHRPSNKGTKSWLLLQVIKAIINQGAWRWKESEVISESFQARFKT